MKKGCLQGETREEARTKAWLGLERSQVWALPEKQPGWSSPLLLGGAQLLAPSAAPGTQGAEFSVQLHL